jgi:hypothetical protein
MKKKEYNQPQTEVSAFETETLLQGMVMSINTGGSGKTEAPRRRGEIIP